MFIPFLSREFRDICILLFPLVLTYGSVSLGSERGTPGNLLIGGTVLREGEIHLFYVTAPT